jgi:hypothetical protein
MNTQIKKVSLQVTESNHKYTVFTEYETPKGKSYYGHNPFKKLSDAMNEVHKHLNINENGFISDLNGYYIITFPNNDNKAIKTFIKTN